MTRRESTTGTLVAPADLQRQFAAACGLPVAKPRIHVRATEREVPAVEYRRIPHAAHYHVVNHLLGTAGHDLEQWDYAQPARLPRPEGVAADAQYHSGFVRDGVQHWTYVRRAPLSADFDCAHCAARGSL